MSVLYALIAPTLLAAQVAKVEPHLAPLQAQDLSALWEGYSPTSQRLYRLDRRDRSHERFVISAGPVDDITTFVFRIDDVSSEKDVIRISGASLDTSSMSFTLAGRGFSVRNGRSWFKARLKILGKSDGRTWSEEEVELVRGSFLAHVRAFNDQADRATLRVKSPSP
jgi:hypothetical protein